jgi:hypothetical protein
MLMAVPRGSADADSEMIGGEAPVPGSESFDTPGVMRTWQDAPNPANAPERCKFLRSIGPDGKLFDPGNDAVPTHRCAAFGDPLPLSLRQQELVCLQRVHISCPRYMRGTLLAEESANIATQIHQPQSGLPRLTLAGLALVALAGLALVAGMMGIIPGTGSAASSPTSPLGAVTASPAAPTVAPTPAPTPTVALTPSPAAPTSSATPKPSASATPSHTPSPTPVASPTWPPGATAPRMALLVPCTPVQANCWVYTVRGPAQNGTKVTDTVKGIANYFGVSITQIYAMNPGAKAGIHAGDKLKIPSPTR